MPRRHRSTPWSHYDTAETCGDSPQASSQTSARRSPTLRRSQDSDDRSYQSWVGIHGLPLPISCKHASHLFLPWHRADLYFFEKELQDRVAGVTFPWWDWTTSHAEGLPEAYARGQSSDRRKNPLFDSPIQPAGRRDKKETRTWREGGSGQSLPSPDQLGAVLDNSDFYTFQAQLENIHNGIHGWIGGTMNDPYVAAYDPIFWAHHAMIDRCWYSLAAPPSGGWTTDKHA